jgi:prepilin peptidase CpaA
LFRTTDAVVLGVTVAATAAAVITDLRARRIPNAVTAATAITGLALAALGASGISFRASFVGFVLGLLLMLPGHLLGATGAGDVKLLAAVGAVLGPQRILAAFLYTAIAGGALALVVALRGRRLRRTLASSGRLLIQPAAARGEIEAPHRRNRFAYGPAIAVGSILAALGS